MCGHQLAAALSRILASPEAWASLGPGHPKKLFSSATLPGVHHVFSQGHAMKDHTPRVLLLTLESVSQQWSQRNTIPDVAFPGSLWSAHFSSPPPTLEPYHSHPDPSPPLTTVWPVP